MLLQMFTVNDEAVGPHLQHGETGFDHERLVLEARDVAFDWTKLPFHYVPGEPFTTHMLNVLHLLLPAGEEFFVDLFKQALPLIKDDELRLDVLGLDDGFGGGGESGQQRREGERGAQDGEGRRHHVKL